MEKDDEVKGEGNHYDLGLRHYDPRIGRMFSIDPRATEYPWQSQYVYHRNNPINQVDYLGGGDPPGYETRTAADGSDVIIPEESDVTLFKDTDGDGKISLAVGPNNTIIETNAKPGTVARFTTRDGLTYIRRFNEKGTFTGYYTTSGVQWKKPNDVAPSDFIIMIAFPDKSAGVTGLGRIIDLNFDGELPVGHAGAIIVSAKSGETRYFDFGRYKSRNSELGPHPEDILTKLGLKDYGIVRSVNTVPTLSTPKAIIVNGEITNMNSILYSIQNNSDFRGYKQMTAGLITGVDYYSMISYATGKENAGWMIFACPHFNYCAKFSRQIARAGGAKIPEWVKTGQQNVNNTNNVLIERK